jgi:hypothetical protein
MNEMQLRQLLNQGIQVRPEIAKRLEQAREQALERQRPERGAVLALRVLLPLAVLVGSGAAIYTWQQNQRVAELEEIDSQLLTDDLPIDAYLDRGFQSWLKKRMANEE